MSKLTIKQAVQYTGKSEASVRRLVRKWSVPTHAYAKYVQKEKGKYYIRDQALKDHPGQKIYWYFLIFISFNIK